MDDQTILMYPWRARPATLPRQDPGSLRRQRLEFQAEAAALMIAAWERIHAADAVASRLQQAGEGVDDGELGFEDALAALATRAAGLDRAVIQPALRAEAVPARTPAALTS